MAETIDQLQIEITNDSNKVNTSLNKLVKTLEKLKIAANDAGLNSFKEQLRGVSDAADKAKSPLNKLIKQQESLQRTVESFGVHARNFTRVARVVTDELSKWFKSTSRLVEATNLFTVAMGEGAQAAYEYGQKVQDIMGIDIHDWITSVGTFNQMLLGFGIENKQANQISQLLTQVGYDISSLFDVDVKDSMDKLQSGIAGMVKGMRDYGVELSVAAIQEMAYAKGMNKTVSSMNMAEKVQLRVLTILEKTKNMQGDLARTLVTPANAVRILRNRFEILKRTLGETVSVILARLLPAINVLVSMVTEAAAKMSAAFGYELPEIDYSSLKGLSTGVGDLEEGFNSASEAARKLKQNVMGFDELNIVNPLSGVNMGEETGFGDSFSIDWSKYEYDFLGNVFSNTKEIEDKLRPIFEIVSGIGLALAGWLVVEKISPAITVMTEKAIADLAAFKKYLGSAVMMLVEFKLVYGGVENLLEGKLTGAIQAAVGAALGSAYLYAVWGKAGLAIGISVAVIATIAAISDDIAEGGKTDAEYMKSNLISTVVGTLGGAAAGFFVGGPYGAAIGALLGFGISATIWGIKYASIIEKDKEAAYINSQLRKDIFGDLLDDKGYIQYATEVKLKIENITADMTDIEDKFAGVKEMVDRVFELSELPVKTKEDMSELQTLVQAINDMKLTGLQLQYDELTGKITNSKNEIYGVIEALDLQAKATAAQELLVERYKEQIRIQRELKDANSDLWKAIGIVSGAEEELVRIQEEKKRKIDELAAKFPNYIEQAGWRIKIERDYSGIIDTQNRIIKEAKEKRDEYAYSVATLTDAEKKNKDMIGDLISITGDYRRSLLDVNNKTDDLKGAVDVYNESLANTSAEMDDLKEKTANLATTTDTTVRAIKSRWDELRNADPIVITIREETQRVVNTIYEETATNSALEGLKNRKVPTVATRASGGYVPKGDFFIANEKGPELVGTLGGRTAVANQNQMVDMAAKGVAEALKNYSPGSNESGEIIVKVYLDRKQMTTAVETEKRERGAVLFPAGVVSHG